MSTGNWSCLILSRRVIVLALLVVSVIGLCAQSAGAATLWNSVQSPNGRSHSINQEASGRSRAVIGTCAYDADANPPSVADPTRSQTKYTYDTPAQVVHDFYVVVTGGTGVLVHNVDEGDDCKGGEGISTPYGTAEQGTDAASQALRTDVEQGATVYRQGTFGVQETDAGQFWAGENPLTTSDYAGSYGTPEGSSPDWVMGGEVGPDEPFVTRPAPGLGGNLGGNPEVVTNPGGVRNLWFHMP